jgi:hypothetical protein
MTINAFIGFDIKKVINYITEEGKDEIEEHYGKISTLLPELFSEK